MIEPRSIGDLLGQKRIHDAVRGRFSSKDHHRPLVLIGPEGAGKETLAKLYARALFCLNAIDGLPCSICSDCRNPTDENIGYVSFDGANPDLERQFEDKREDYNLPSLGNHRVVIIRHADHAGDYLDALLKTFEDGAIDTTFILLAEDLRRIRAAAVSRSECYRLRPLTLAEAGPLVMRFLNEKNINGKVVEFLVRYSDGWPGRVAQVCNTVREARATNLDQVKSTLGAGWGQFALSFWQALLSNVVIDANVWINHSTSPLTVANRLRSALRSLPSHVRTLDAPFVGLEDAVEQLQRAFLKTAHLTSQDPDQLWLSLARVWLSRDIVDEVGLASAERASRQLVWIR